MEKLKTDAGLLDRLAFDFHKHRMTAVVGGGGKTHLIFRMAWELVRAGYMVCVTTTTHMRKDEQHPFAEGGDPETVRTLLKNYGYCVAGCTEPKKEGVLKISGIAEERRRELMDLSDFLLVEADGSRGLPVKAPEEWEPVIPQEADLVIGVMGLDALQGPIGETAHRPALLAARLNKGLQDRLTERDLKELALSGQGLRKKAEGKDFRIFLNKDDLPGAFDSGERICRMLREEGLMAGHGHLALRRGELILLAAGRSSRFCSNKLLYEIGGKPMYRRMLEKLVKIAERPGLLPAELSVTVVTQYEEVALGAGACGAKVRLNPHPQEGIASSLRTGLSENRDKDFVLFAVADQPWVREESIRGLLGGWLQSGLGMAALSYGEKIGNPCLFSAPYFEALMKLEGDKGGKRVLMQHPSDVFLYPAEEDCELMDLDYRPGGEGHVYEMEKRDLEPG